VVEGMIWGQRHGSASGKGSIVPPFHWFGFRAANARSLHQLEFPPTTPSDGGAGENLG